MLFCRSVCRLSLHTAINENRTRTASPRHEGNVFNTHSRDVFRKLCAQDDEQLVVFVVEMEIHEYGKVGLEERGANDGVVKVA